MFVLSMTTVCDPPGIAVSEGGPVWRRIGAGLDWWTTKQRLKTSSFEQRGQPLVMPVSPPAGLQQQPPLPQPSGR